MSNIFDADAAMEFAADDKIDPVGRKIKRIIDIAIALSALIVLAPMLIICFALTLATSPGPALFRHKRVGFGGRQFDCLKFRTMVPDAAERLRQLLESDPTAALEWETNRKLRHDPRVTVVGAMMRKASLDELPQLINVLKGDMSIVGPRPVTDEEMVRYSEAVHAYRACRPGITGLWQVSGRSSTTFSKRVACDTFYANRWSLALDARIIAATIPAVCFTDSAY